MHVQHYQENLDKAGSQYLYLTPLPITLNVVNYLIIIDSGNKRKTVK